ncbi:ATP-binding sensor histidine kinase [Fortiea contorta]|uniref:ATP-binding sensor histidine kinase n=1 Tax=Fortiea contorta TaxID=1892405 RepID=UPI00034DB30A|nr:ATP-binding sensor histidine kinase [Fortiea contorta]
MVTTLVRISGYQISEELYNGSRAIVYRGYRETDSLPVVIKLLKNPYPSFSELVQFRNQYTIAKNLDSSLIIATYSLEPYENGYLLVMEDFGGISLKEYFLAMETLDLTSLQEFLKIAIALCNILDILYRDRILHKDIKPSNILINPETKQIKLIDFSIASLLPRETQTLINPHVLEGTLSYISPEQTGRMNRGIDYRTDFYSLGVTFYEFLTKKLPFPSNDAMELIHCHIAKLAPLVHIINPEIPPVISSIVNKLMAKNTEDRYQSALGIKFDLEKCLTQLLQTGTIESFPIAQRDVSDRFIIPDKLYGRETEIDTLLQAFARVSKGTTEMMLVAGFSGIGKTAVVKEIHKPIVRQRGYFIKGKYDQFQRNIPFFAFVQAYRDLMGQLLTESDAQIQKWKNSILEAVGENGQIIIEVIPELERIIGQQAPAPKLSVTADQNRFNLVFQKFTQVFTNQEHPLVIFLDDLQWADSASLKLLQLLMRDTKYLFLIGAYRNNEVSPAHPLMLALGEIKKAQGKINTITLAPLNQEQVNQLIADTLKCTEKLALPLSLLVSRKTQGNPFFATQLLKALYQDQLIQFDSKLGCWQCDSVQVNQQTVTDDIVDFMALQLRRLPQSTQNLLQLAACIGNQFDLATLTIVAEKSAIETASDLWKALQEELILPITDVYKFYQGEQAAELTLTHKDKNKQLVKYKFLHDRIQQAAYSLVTNEQTQINHLKIGQLLLQKTPIQQQDEKLFDIVGQLNMGHELIKKLGDRQQLVELNLQAGRKAKLSTAYTDASHYLAMGVQLLTKNGWEQNYDLMFTLHRERAEVEYLNGDFEQSKALIDLALTKTKSTLEKVELYYLLIIQYSTIGKYNTAIQTGLNALALLGINIHRETLKDAIAQEFADIKQHLTEHSISSLLELSEIDALEQRITIQLLISLDPPTYITSDIDLYVFVSIKAAHLSMKYGNVPVSAKAYANYGFIIGSLLGDYKSGYEFGLLAFNLSQKFNHLGQKSQASMLLGSFISVWCKPIADAVAMNAEGYEVGLAGGELQFAAYNLLGYVCNQVFQGVCLNQIWADIQTYLPFAKKTQNQLLIQTLTGVQLFISALSSTTEQSENKQTLSISNYQFIAACQVSQTFLALSVYYIYQMQLSCVYQDFIPGLKAKLAVEPILNSIVGFTTYSDYYFYSLLIGLNCGLEIDWQQIEFHQAKLKIWADNCPENFLHKYLLVQAEIDRIQGQTLAAIDNYDRAIYLAKINSYIPELGLANELAAKFYLNWGKEKIAQVYLQEAYYSYARWGAKAKINDLEKCYPQQLQPILQQQRINLNPQETIAIRTTSTSTINSSTRSSNISELIDFTSVMKAAQVISISLELDELITRLTEIILENSGAEKSVLILSQDDTWQVRAIAKLDQDKIQTTLNSQSLDNCEDVPVKLIYYVKNTQQTVVINNCKTDIPGVIGQYMLKYQPQSVLCTPIINQGHLVGILYLENQLTSEVFTCNQLLVTNFLCAQAATSLENARLYQLEKERFKILEIKTKILSFRGEIDSSLIRSATLREMLQTCTEIIMKHLDAAFARIWTVNPAENMLELQASAGLYTHIDGPHSRVPIGKFKIGLIAEQCLPHLTNDVMNDPRVGDKEWAKREGMRAFAGYPLMFNNQLLGVVAMFSRQRLTSDSLDALAAVASEIGIWIARNQSEYQLSQRSQELEQALQDLQHAQLKIIQSEKMSALGNLVAGVAHEMNNPLSFIAASLKHLKPTVADISAHLKLYQDSLPNPGEEILNHAEAIDLEYSLEDLPKIIDSMVMASDRLKTISTSLRIFSRADKDYKVPFNIHEGINSTILILKHRLKANAQRPEIEVITEYGDLPLIECFPGQINQVFMNILANAIDALDESSNGRSFAENKDKHHRIIIQILVKDERIQIKIVDNGLGISEDIKAKIFDHLFTTKEVGKGTGLGLAIARQIVEEKHAGTIRVNSVLNQGTEFIITLPIKLPS